MDDSVIKETKALFEYIRSFDLNSIPDLNTMLSDYNFSYIPIEDLLCKISFGKNILILDARSENEYLETHLPEAVNFPVLNDKERHNTGLIYSKYSPLAAVKLAAEYADPKMPGLKKKLAELKAGLKEIFVYCWRGGGRSKYLAKMIFDCGFKPVILTGGIKSYRKKVMEFFAKDFDYNLIELNGLTGTGKTEILREVSSKIPVLDLEKSARHFSSLFGFIPYKIRGYETVKNQSAFENDIFAQIVLQMPMLKEYNFFLVESESKKVGDFFIPQNIYLKMLEAKSINIYRNIEVRIEHIINDYFGTENQGLVEMEKIFTEKERLFRKELSNKSYETLLNFLQNGDKYRFTKGMIEEYYDKKYRDKGKTPLTSICSDDVRKAGKELISFLSYINKQD
ncbi:MAG: tRNA 2-selenouridine(34) synthase MnmH [Ignavibacteriae bacterium]|nr:tRNA 2-selenouridine(34) synthase MnmH [Ignavibacteriota bacterium]